MTPGPAVRTPKWAPVDRAMPETSLKRFVRALCGRRKSGSLPSKIAQKRRLGRETKLGSDPKSDPVRAASRPEKARTTAAERTAVRFEQRRSDIVAAAIPVLNGQGLKGMRLTEIAELIGLRATGVTYYFPRKEELAVACFESGIAIFHELLAVAEREPDARSRVSRLIELFVERDAAVRRGEAAPLAAFGAMSALEGAHFDQVYASYGGMYRRARALFESPEMASLDKGTRSIRTLMLLEQLYWSGVWLDDNDLEEFPRLARRVTDVVVNGLASADAEFSPSSLVLGEPDASAEGGNDAFLKAATRQINAHGYRGASVDRIAASLNLTKGAFYHHNHAKEDLALACFRRSFGIIREAQRKAQALPVSEWDRLVTAVTALIRFQLSAEGPLLRTAVITSMPPDHQAEIIAQSHRAGRSFAAMIADAVTEGSARAVDPTIAAHLLNAAINVASEIQPLRMSDGQTDPAVYARALFFGLLQV
jgi:AcrR family transcriptional regulator